MYLLLALVIGVLTLLYFYLIWNFNYWKDRGVKGPTPKPIFGNLRKILLGQTSFLYDINDLYIKFKSEKFIGIFAFRLPQIVAIGPAFMQSIMITNFKFFVNNEFSYQLDKKTDPVFGRNPFMLKGTEWKDKRIAISPAFTTSRIKSIQPIVSNSCHKLTNHIKEKALEDGFHIKNLIDKYTVDLVSNSIFGHDPQSFNDGPNIFVDMIDLMSVQTIQKFILMAGLPSIIKYFLRVPYFSKKVRDFFIKMTNHAIKYREENGIEQIDFLQYFMELKSKRLECNEEIVSNEAMMFFDAVDTSSQVIANTLQSLGENERVQQKLREEIHETIKEFGEIDFDILMDKMPYLNQVFIEATRLHPPIPVTSRHCIESIDMPIGDDRKVRIEKGTVIIIPIWSVHHNPEYYPDPMEFRPERFDAQSGGVKRFTDEGIFIPFGAGPRICLGMRLAQVQIKAALVELIKNFKISVNRKSYLTLKLDKNKIFYEPEDGVWLNFKQL